MSADINTRITIKGSPQQILSMVQAIKEFATVKYKQYRKNHDCAYITYVSLNNSGREMNLDGKTKDKDLISYIGSISELEVSAMGPYGIYDDLYEAGLFEAIADAAPGAEFKGSCDGFISDEDVSLSAEFKDGRLALVSDTIFDGIKMTDYVKYISEKMPYSEFCDLFKLDKDEFDIYSYDEFIMDAIGEEGFPDIDFDTFLEYCEDTELEEDEYNKVIGEMEKYDLIDYFTFEDEIFDNSKLDGCAVNYDPISKKYHIG